MTSVVAFAGSLRRRSFNRALLDAAKLLFVALRDEVRPKIQISPGSGEFLGHPALRSLQRRKFRRGSKRSRAFHSFELEGVVTEERATLCLRPL